MTARRTSLLLAAVAIAAVLAALASRAPRLRAPDHPPAFSSWEPPSLEVRPAGRNAWSIPFPEDSRTLPAAVVKEPHILLELGHPVAMRALELGAEDGAVFRAWATVLDGAGGQELVALGERKGARVEMPLPASVAGRRVASLRIAYRPGGPAVEPVAPIPPAKILRELGKANTYMAPPGLGEADDLDHPRRSALFVLEDGKLLGPAHAMHDDIRKNGAGRYSHWQGTFYFSSSDGSDPRTNGRQYAVARRTPNEIRIAIP